MAKRVVLGIILSPFIFCFAVGATCGYILIWLCDLGEYVFKGKLGYSHSRFWSNFRL